MTTRAHERQVSCWATRAAADGGDGTHNCHFTLSATMTATYSAGMVLSASGNDDVWIYINGQVRRPVVVVASICCVVIQPNGRPHLGQCQLCRLPVVWVLSFAVNML